MIVIVLSLISNDLLRQLDALAQAQSRSREEVILDALRAYLDAHGAAVRPGDLRQVQAAVQTQDEIARLSSGTGEDSAEDVRRWRDRDR